MKAMIDPKIMPISSPLESSDEGETETEGVAVEMFGAELVGEVLKGVEWNEDDVRGVAVKVELGATGVTVADATDEGEYKPPQVHAPSVPRGICVLVSRHVS